MDRCLTVKSNTTSKTENAGKEDMRGILDFIKQFPDEQACIEKYIQMRWKGQIKCAYCNHDKIYKIKEYKRYKCGKCNRSFSITSKSIFANSKIPLRSWFLAIILLYNHKKGYPSTQLAKDLGISIRSAWHLEMKLRIVIKHLKDNSILSGIVEMDEAYMGRRDRKVKANDNKSTRGKGTTKQVMIGMIERGGRVIVVPAHNTKGETILKIANKYIDQNALLLTDDSPVYNLAEKTFKRKRVRHRDYSKRKYNNYPEGREQVPRWAYFDTEVNVNVHSNTIEGFWSIAKNGILITHHSVSKKYLDLYCDEFAERQSKRNIPNRDKFENFLTNTDGVEITWKDIRKRKPNIYG